MSNNKTKGKNRLLNFIIVFFILFMIVLIYIKVKQDNDPQKIKELRTQEIFSSIDKLNSVNVTKYAVYGTHFNVEGTLDIINISGINVDYVDLILKDLNGNEEQIKSEFNISDNILSFSTFSELNSGIDFESLNCDDYFILLKVTYSNSDVKYYSLSNASNYNDITYYTITKNGKNNKIDVSFKNYNDISYMSIIVDNATSLPDDVYDIALDPGHGGLDKGAKSGEYTESNIVLDFCISLKTELENLGLKVFVSRSENDNPKEDTTLTMYDDNGRINLLNASHAKLILSIHVNENKYSKDSGGVEVYAPCNCNLDFASTIASSIVTSANTEFSKNNMYQEKDGVYVKNFRNADIVASDARANKNGYEPYKITTSTPYIYVIRETGGISTNAFVDGRNKSFGTNKFFNSNVGIEAYQIELGYMAISKDLENILNNKQGYIDGIVQSIKSYYKIGI